MIFKHWINAIRLHTLLLSVSGITSSFILSLSRYRIENSYTKYILCIITALLLQILANFSNDYGDAIKGIDKFRKFGPKRMVIDGFINYNSMKLAIFLFSILSFFSGLLLIYVSIPINTFVFILFFLGIVLCICCAITYSVGFYSYGSFALGDFFVFIFFGIISVLGSYFLYTNAIHLDVFLLSLSIGLLNVAVLNVNNMRDIDSDYTCGKYTIANLLGIKYAKVYHIFIIITSLFLGWFFIFLNKRSIYQCLLLFLFLFFYSFHIKNILFLKENHFFNSELRKLVRIIFLYSICMGLINYL
ncbi:1,4-dihydroxy-2-naphthoate octaprenyltransferase [Blattabacterium cuenoti]|uniref:1,4-dihydroxy-2-naphthoate octaprenyltransferase n=1 Tax=Blattabacterium cuenoti TaxID=1653831 RepID=UPI00163CB252|nr:1,4-dihydroxy-2-naphthoate octaprenyltransferase [Blattabacterium cuenoti]